jgi:hypothetical protein
MSKVATVLTSNNWLVILLHDIQHNDTQHIDIQHYDTEHKGLICDT